MKIKNNIIGFIVTILLIASSVYGLTFEEGVEIFMTDGSVNVTYNFTNQITFSNLLQIDGLTLNLDNVDNITLTPSSSEIFNGFIEWSVSNRNFSMIGENQTVTHNIVKDNFIYPIIYDDKFYIAGVEDINANSTNKFWRYGINGTVDLNLSFGPDNTNVFRVIGCGPGIQNISALPEGQNSSRGIDYVCNNGTITTNVSVKLIESLNSGWPTIWVSNNSGYSEAINLTNNQATPKTIFRRLNVGSCFYAWFNFTCNNVTQNPGVYEQYNATG